MYQIILMDENCEILRDFYVDCKGIAPEEAFDIAKKQATAIGEWPEKFVQYQVLLES